MLTNFALAMGIGAVMGLLTHITKNKTIKKPRNTKYAFYPGFLTDCLYGAVAALAVVIVADPNGIERVILTSILAGYAGETAIAKLESQRQSENAQAVKQVESKEASKVPPEDKQKQK